MAKQFRVRPNRYVAFAGQILNSGQTVSDERLANHPDFEEVVEVEGIGTATVIDITKDVPILGSTAVGLGDVTPTPARGPILVPSAEAVEHGQRLHEEQDIVQELSGKIGKKGKKQ